MGSFGPRGSERDRSIYMDVWITCEEEGGNHPIVVFSMAALCTSPVRRTAIRSTVLSMPALVADVRALQTTVRALTKQLRSLTMATGNRDAVARPWDAGKPARPSLLLFDFETTGVGRKTADIRIREVGVTSLTPLRRPPFRRAVDPGIAVDARALAVPEPEHAIDLAVALRLDLLRSEHSCRRKILVHGGKEFDAVPLQPILDAPELEVDAAERRAPIAGDEACRVEPGCAVASRLVERNADDGLRAREEDAALLALVAIGELVRVE